MASLTKSTIPRTAWIITSMSGLVLAVGVSISTIKSSSLSVQIADFRLDSTVKFSKVLELSKELEAKAIALQEKETAYSKLKTEYDNLVKHNQPVKLLQPAIEEVERISTKTNLEELEKSAGQTAKEAANSIKEISKPLNLESKEKETILNKLRMIHFNSFIFSLL